VSDLQLTSTFPHPLINKRGKFKLQ